MIIKCHHKYSIVISSMDYRIEYATSEIENKGNYSGLKVKFSNLNNLIND